MRKITFFSLFTFLLLAACNEDAGAHQPSEEMKEPAAEETETTVQDADVVEDDEVKPNDTNVFPLTGEPTEDSVDHPVVSVMVNNHAKARPQSGLSQADMVYEVLAEGQITRFLALFHSEIPDTIGPVRSARPYYFELAAGYDALYVYHGASTAINEQVAASGVSFIDGGIYDNNGWLFQRSSDRVAPHNSYLLADGIERAMGNKGYSTEYDHDRLTFDGNAQLDGKPLDRVTITYSSRSKVSFSYDADDQHFVRSSDGEATIDQSNDDRVAVENVWIIEADHQVIDNVGRRDIDLTSGGDGYLLQKGQLKKVQWKNVDGRLLPFEDGELLPFTPGKTWVNIIPKNATVETTYSSS